LDFIFFFRYGDDSGPTDRNLFYLETPSPTGMRDLKKELNSKVDLSDIGIDKPTFKIDEYLRVLKLARKPTREEFLMISKIAGMGIILIGMIGFLIYVLLTELPRGL
jgi:protein transport protein SEC61 subunit gamma-like protein